MLDQLTLPYLIFFLIFTTCLLDIVLIKSEVTHGSERIDPDCFTLPQKAGFITIIHYSSKSQHSSSSLMHTSRLGLTDHIAAFNRLVMHTEVVDGCNWPPRKSSPLSTLQINVRASSAKNLKVCGLISWWWWGTLIYPFSRAFDRKNIPLTRFLYKAILNYAYSSWIDEKIIEDIRLPEGLQLCFRIVWQVIWKSLQISPHG